MEVAVACGVVVAVAVGVRVCVCVCVGDAMGTVAKVGVGAGLSVALGVKVEAGGVLVSAHETLQRIVAAIRAPAIRAINLLRQMYKCRTVAASLPRLCLERASKWVTRQMFAHGISQNTLAPAMYDAYRIESVPQCLVEEQF